MAYSRRPSRAMETTFYDDQQFRSGKNDFKSSKRPVTLDLDSPSAMTKKQRFTALLTSPDLNMLKLASPELERFIIANGNITTTPTPTQFLFPKNVTEEQEQYARGFVDALNQLHQTSFEVNNTFFTCNSDISPLNISTSNSSITKLYPSIVPIYLQPTTTSVIKTPGSAKNTMVSTVNSQLVVRPPSVENTSSNSCQSSSLSLPLEISVKEELQMVPNDISSPPMSPLYKSIDMADQERIKLERKRHRNRIAATKCRRRKLEKISKLEDKVKELKDENSELGAIADKLRGQVCSLKQQVLEHVKCGCQIMITHGV